MGASKGEPPPSRRSRPPTAPPNHGREGERAVLSSLLQPRPHGVAEPGKRGSAFLAPPDLSQKGELVQTERIIRLAKAANISLGPK